VNWNAASDDWHTVRATNDLTVGGALEFRMEAKDGSEGFDLKGTYTEIIPCEKLAYTLTDGRHVGTSFSEENGQARIVTSFEPESENPPAVQQGGWQAILDNFKKYAEAQG
jgi:uncharacterized protein YndB with AHSA1/START domain